MAAGNYFKRAPESFSYEQFVSGIVFVGGGIGPVTWIGQRNRRDLFFPCPLRNHHSRDSLAVVCCNWDIDTQQTGLFGNIEFPAHPNEGES
ncbi:MAG: hypothetical protein ACREFR_01500, partial [Limisphaerales bacterium]